MFPVIPKGRAGVAAQVGLVGAAVVGQHSFHHDAAFGEPRDGSMQHGDSGGGGLVVVALGVGDSVVGPREREVPQSMTMWT